jgi:hypothetical protein
MKKLNIVLFIAFFIIIGCNKEENNSIPTDNQNIIPTFSGYTAMDEVGNPIGVADTSDWTNDDDWMIEEKALFEDYESLSHKIPFDTGLKIHPAFPNPCSEIFLLALVKDSITMFRAKLVNQKFDILIAADSIYNKTMMFKLDELNISTDSMLRLYYMFIKDDSCLYKGHGDIKIN